MKELCFSNLILEHVCISGWIYRSSWHNHLLLQSITQATDKPLETSKLLIFVLTRQFTLALAHPALRFLSSSIMQDSTIFHHSSGLFIRVPGTCAHMPHTVHEAFKFSDWMMPTLARDAKPIDTTLAENFAASYWTPSRVQEV